MPAVYDCMGVKFLYPENWTLDDGVDDEESPDARQNSVWVYSPGGAFWSVSIYPPNRAATELAAEVLHTLRSEYESVAFDSETVTETVEGQDMVGYDMSFIYLDLTSTAVVRGFTTPRATYVVFFQAEDRELAEIRPVFDAMTTSLLREL